MNNYPNDIDRYPSRVNRCLERKGPNKFRFTAQCFMKLSGFDKGFSPSTDGMKLIIK